ncbi:hypothetical protein ACP6NG_14345 [Brevibacterium casei]|uniref:8-oxoguanine DNA glycosylase OGG fold protein n=1 Tax=Brevibacterium casei TaxID=33889 RepID=UPI002469782D|nr:hypothetical protein [Brevibacterium casei]MDH5147271.1 hypothetical protein [Brevibacterium casei]
MKPECPAPAVLEKHLELPRKLQPAFHFDQNERWIRWLGHLRDLEPALIALPSVLDRRTVAEHVAKYAPTTPIAAFLSVMVWGYGSAGYGPYRVARILTQSRSPLSAALDETVVSRLQEGYSIASTAGTTSGYEYMNSTAGRIKHFGPAFFTKWLYFSTASNPELRKDAAPILDRRVLRWLSKQNITLKLGDTESYTRYLALLSAWGQDYDVGPSEVEEQIFMLTEIKAPNTLGSRNIACS